HAGTLRQLDLDRRAEGVAPGGEELDAVLHGGGHPSSGTISRSATRARNSLLGLNTGTGRAETSTGAPVRGLRAIRVFRLRILKVPNPRTSMFCCCFRASLMASRKASTTRAQSFFEIIGPEVWDIASV